MDEPDFHISYSSFRSFIECSGQQATHRIRGDQYVRPASAGSPCYSREDCNFLLCDSCLAFWWQCRENDDLPTWDTALFFRGQLEDAQVSKLLDTCTHRSSTRSVVDTLPNSIGEAEFKA